MKMSLPLSPLAVASAISHIALAFILLDTRVELSGVRENAPTSHRSLLGDADVPMRASRGASGPCALPLLQITTPRLRKTDVI